MITAINLIIGAVRPVNAFSQSWTAPRVLQTQFAYEHLESEKESFAKFGAYQSNRKDLLLHKSLLAHQKAGTHLQKRYKQPSQNVSTRTGLSSLIIYAIATGISGKSCN